MNLKTIGISELVNTMIMNTDALENMFMTYSRAVSVGDINYINSKTKEFESMMSTLSSIIIEIKSRDIKEVRKITKGMKLDIDELIETTVNTLSVIENGIEIVNNQIFNNINN